MELMLFSFFLCGFWLFLILEGFSMNFWLGILAIIAGLIIIGVVIVMIRIYKKWFWFNLKNKNRLNIVTTEEICLKKLFSGL